MTDLVDVDVAFLVAHALPAPVPECECPLEHSIAKLGHCCTCTHHGVGVPERPEVPTLPGCPPRHADGTPHDFDWATYADDDVSCGVCYCGYDDWSQALWEGL